MYSAAGFIATPRTKSDSHTNDVATHATVVSENANGTAVDAAEAKKAVAKRPRAAIGANFVAPDGGWGWFVVVAAGLSNLCTYPVLQQFGLLFKGKLFSLGLSAKEISTIINMNACITSCVGLINGPVFRTFSYRQIAFVGALVSAMSVFATTWANSFFTFLLTFSVLYGLGTGINQSANALALNTYFKEKRRIATGISWTLTGMGPIIFPQIIALLLPAVGIHGTVLFFGCLASVAVLLSLVYQPVEWHTKSGPPGDAETQKRRDDTVYAPTEVPLCTHCQNTSRKSHNLVSGQYLLNSDDPLFTGYEIIDPGTPMMSKSNDGWYSMTPARRSLYSSHVSLTSGFTSRKHSSANLFSTGSTKRGDKRSRTEAPDLDELELYDAEEFKAEIKSNRTSSTNLYKEGKRDKLKNKDKLKNNEFKIEEAEVEDCPSYKAPQDIAGGKFKLNVDNLTIPKELPNGRLVMRTDHPKSEPVFTIKGMTQTSPRIVLPETPSAAINMNDWAKPVSNIPTRNQSVLSMQFYNSQPRRNMSTNSFQAEQEVLDSVRNQLEQFVSKDIYCTCNQMELLPKRQNIDAPDDDDDDEPEEVFTLWQKIYIFFDLDLLKDWTFINLMVGMTIACFTELNYSILTPFVLNDFGLSAGEISTSMSVLGAMDLLVRFFVPFIAGKIGWQNKSFFLFGVLGMAMGRISIAHFHSYPAVMAASVWIGMNKGLRTVFMALVIPSYVPLHRLPGATGLQLLFAGLFYFTAGPLIGLIRDSTNYTVTLHCLNIPTFTTAICWGLEKLIADRRNRKRAAQMQT